MSEGADLLEIHENRILAFRRVRDAVEKILQHEKVKEFKSTQWAALNRIYQALSDEALKSTIFTTPKVHCILDEFDIALQGGFCSEITSNNSSVITQTVGEAIKDAQFDFKTAAQDYCPDYKKHINSRRVEMIAGGLFAAIALFLSRCNFTRTHSSSNDAPAEPPIEMIEEEPEVTSKFEVASSDLTSETNWASSIRKITPPIERSGP